MFCPHPLPNPSGSARISVTESHLLILAEGEQNINDFLTRIFSSKQDFNGCHNKFFNKEIFGALRTTAYEAKDNFFS